MGLINLRRFKNANSGCRPGCGCLIFIALLLLIGYAMMNFFGGMLPNITLPGGTRIEIPRTNRGGDSGQDGSTWDGGSGSGGNNGGNSIDYNNKLRKGLPDDDKSEEGAMDV